MKYLIKLFLLLFLLPMLGVSACSLAEEAQPVPSPAPEPTTTPTAIPVTHDQLWDDYGDRISFEGYALENAPPPSVYSDAWRVCIVDVQGVIVNAYIDEDEPNCVTGKRVRVTGMKAPIRSITIPQPDATYELTIIPVFADGVELLD